MRVALVAALVMLTTACGAYHFPGGDQSSTGTVTGQVDVVGCGPVQPVAGICAPSRPMPKLELDFNGGGTVTSTITDANGGFSIHLPPETYKVTVNAPFIIVSGPGTVTVTSGETVVANYVVDSGIRAPLPNQ